MKTKFIAVMLVGLLFVSTAFAPITHGTSVAEAAVWLICPDNPNVTGTTNNSSFIHATANLRTYKDGYEWTVGSGAFIMSGQGTNQISIGKDCPTGSIDVCARAFINQPGGGVCYSAWVCTTINYSGPCFLI